MDTKQCSKCNVIKHLDDFFKDKNNKTDGRYSSCKQCKQGNTLSWRRRNQDKYNADQRKQHKKHYQRNRLYRYKMTPEQHANLLAEQKGVCDICFKMPKGKRPLAIDHNHKTGQVRGLLCYGCNRALHTLEHDDLLMKALAYLDKWHTKSKL